MSKRFIYWHSKLDPENNGVCYNRAYQEIERSVSLFYSTSISLVQFIWWISAEHHAITGNYSHPQWTRCELWRKLRVRWCTGARPMSECFRCLILSGKRMINFSWWLGAKVKCTKHDDTKWWKNWQIIERRIMVRCTPSTFTVKKVDKEGCFEFDSWEMSCARELHCPFRQDKYTGVSKCTTRFHVQWLTAALYRWAINIVTQ